jgi:hypothetical protein
MHRQTAELGPATTTMLTSQLHVTESITKTRQEDKSRHQIESTRTAHSSGQKNQRQDADDASVRPQTGFSRWYNTVTRVE